MSKTDSFYPKVGNVRTLAVSSPVLKLYEHILLGRLRSELSRIGGLHCNQRGFVEGCSCTDNITYVIDIVRELK